MNKSIAISQLPLPKDVIDHICNFHFYTLSECIKNTKQHYTKLIQELNGMVRYQLKSYQSYIRRYYYIQFSLPCKEIILCVCMKCGNFVDTPQPTCNCKC